MNKTDISNFYTFGEKLSSATVQAHPIGLNVAENDKISKDISRLLLGSYSKLKFPITFKQVHGNRFDDVIRTGTAILYLISDKLKNLLERNSLTGWATFPVKIFDKKGQEVKGYHGLSITGRSGPIDYNKSEIIEKRLVPNGPLGKYYKGLHVGLNKWDGSDFFIPEGTFHIIITNNTTEVLKKNKLTNIKIENLSEIEIPDFALQNLNENSMSD